MLTKKARLLLSLTAATPLLFAACTDNNILNPNTDAPGTYQLTIFADEFLPFEWSALAGEDFELPNGGTVRVTDGTLLLHTDGTFTETNNFTKTPPGGPSFASAYVSTGTYAVNGTAFNFSAPRQNGYSARNASGTFQFDTVDYVEDGFGFEYQRVN